MENKTYAVAIYDKEGNLLRETSYKTLKEAREAYKEKCKRVWLEINLIEVYDYEDSRSTMLIEKQEIEVNI